MVVFLLLLCLPFILYLATPKIRSVRMYCFFLPGLFERTRIPTETYPPSLPTPPPPKKRKTRKTPRGVLSIAKIWSSVDCRRDPGALGVGVARRQTPSGREKAPSPLSILLCSFWPTFLLAPPASGWGKPESTAGFRP